MLSFALIPNGFSPEQISTLSDTQRIGGKLVGMRGINALNRIPRSTALAAKNDYFRGAGI